MAEAACLKTWKAAGHELSYQNSGDSPSCHVRRSTNPDGTYNVCGSRDRLVNCATGATALQGCCVLEQITEPDEPIAPEIPTAYAGLPGAEG
jgi:hypothetical protein